MKNRLEAQISNTWLFCCYKSSNNHSRNQLSADWKRLKHLKKRQSLFFKHILCKNH